ncbi:MAG: TonB-dependent receptor plug domain-containing protein, partial [Candidatus Binataceae bacterium]
MAAASILCALLLLNTASARADEPAPQPFDISPQSLATALSAFARQSQQEILYSPDVVAQKLSSGVHGTLRPLAALKILLKDSGLTVTTTPKGAILVGTPPATSADSQSASSKESITSDAVSTQGEKPERPFGDRIRLAQATQDASAQIAPTQSGEAARGEALEEIVVTASKRAGETLKEVPGALTALTGKTLDTLGIVDFQDYLPYVPGLSSNPSGTTGTPGTYNVILRGLNTGSSQATATVGYYLDDMPLTPSATNSTGGIYAPDPDFGDVDHIEVLKGPQATLYGASTLGGLIKIVSKKPDLTTFSGDVSVGGVTVDGGGTGYT